MSQLRKDIITGRWVIIAAERSKRPDDFRSPNEAVRSAEQGFCPFCEGNESKTPPEVFALRKEGTEPDSEGWRIRVVPNKFPALSRGNPPGKNQNGLFEWMDGVGVHEVVVETTDHDREVENLPLDHIRDILWTFQQRVLSIESEHQYQYVQVFKNKGKEAGASLSHPHSQIVATPIIPKRVKEELYGSERLFRKLKECAFCRIIQDELRSGERVVWKNSHFCVIAPFASRFPFEMRVYPLRHTPNYTDLREDELQSLAQTLKAILSRLKTLLSDPAYNSIIHQGPNPALRKGQWSKVSQNFHWHFEIIPVLTRMAGFELGTGFYINPVSPETAAEYLAVKE